MQKTSVFKQMFDKFSLKIFLILIFLLKEFTFFINLFIMEIIKGNYVKYYCQSKCW